MVFDLNAIYLVLAISNNYMQQKPSFSFLSQVVNIRIVIGIPEFRETTEKG